MIGEIVKIARYTLRHNTSGKEHHRWTHPCKDGIDNTSGYTVVERQLITCRVVSEPYVVDRYLEVVVEIVVDNIRSFESFWIELLG